MIGYGWIARTRENRDHRRNRLRGRQFVGVYEADFAAVGLEMCLLEWDLLLCDPKSWWAV